MNKMSGFTLLKRATAAMAVFLFTANLAQAHTALRESTPANDATLAKIPTELNLVFNGPVRLVKLELMGVGHEMPTSFKPSTEAVANFSFETPGMHPGEFTVNWAAIGADGHTVSNSFSFVVSEGAENSAP